VGDIEAVKDQVHIWEMRGVLKERGSMCSVELGSDGGY